MTLDSQIDFITKAMSNTKGVTFKEREETESYIEVRFSIKAEDEFTKAKFVEIMYDCKEYLNCEITLTADNYFKFYTGKVYYGCRVFKTKC